MDAERGIVFKLQSDCVFIILSLRIQFIKQAMLVLTLRNV